MGINVDDVWVVDDAGEGVENVDGARMRPGGAICESLREANLAQTWLVEVSRLLGSKMRLRRMISPILPVAPMKKVWILSWKVAPGTSV